MKKIILQTILVAFITLGSFNCFAQVVYTDINPDITISASVSETTKSYFIDLDNNRVYEFELRHFNAGPSFEFVEIHRNSVGDQMVILDSSGHSTVLSMFAPVAPTSVQWGLDQYGILNDPWYGGGDKYFGFRFKISGQWHYGWARVKIPANHLSFTIMDYAYNSVPNSPINAGQGITGINDSYSEANNISIFPNPFNNSTTIQFSELANHGEICIYNLYGQRIEKIEVIARKEIVIYRNQLPSGVYFISYSERNAIKFTSKLILID